MRDNRLMFGGLACGGGGCLTSVLVLGILVFRFMAFSPYSQFRRHNSTGNSYYSNGQYQQAAAEYTAMITAMPRRNDGYFLRAMAEYKIGAYNRAVSDNTSVLQMHVPWQVTASAHYNRGLDYEALHEYGKAIEDFDADLKDKNDNDAISNRSECYRLQGDPDTGKVTPMREYQASLRKYTNLIAQGNTRINTREYTAAEDAFRAAERLVPCDPVAWANLSWTQYLKGEVSKAIEANKTAIKIDPNLAFVRCNMGLYYAVQGNGAEAESNYEAAVPCASNADIASARQDIRDAKVRYPNASTILDGASAVLPAGRSSRPTRVQ